MSMVQIASQAEALGLVTHSSDDPLESLRGIQAGGGGGTPLYGLYRYVRRQRVWFFGCFGHK